MNYKVYIHIFPNNKRYIGLTTQEVKNRWKNGIGYRTQNLIYRAILKYGWKSIQHIVYEVDTESEMKYLEKYLIAYYNTTDHRFGYNVSEGGDGTLGVGRKPIDQYDKQGNFIRTWESIISIEQELGFGNQNLSKCIRKKRPTAYGFYWCYSGETPEFKTYGTCRKVYQYTLNGDFVAEFENASIAAKSLGKSNSPIVGCCNGKRKTAYKYVWTYDKSPLSL